MLCYTPVPGGQIHALHVIVLVVDGAVAHRGADAQMSRGGLHSFLQACVPIVLGQSPRVDDWPPQPMASPNYIFKHVLCASTV